MLEFRYTTDEDRKIFSEKADEIGLIKLMKMVHNINWREYSFDSSCTILHTIEDDMGYEYVVKRVRAHCSKVPYHIFGGSVYSLYTINEPDWNHFMDPTADVDVSIDFPIIDSIGENEPLEEYWKSVLKHGDGKTELTKPNEMIIHYLEWLLNEVYTLFKREFTNIYDDLEKYAYETPSILTRNIRNKVHFSIIQEHNMIKIQIECKVIGMQNPDHLLELVIISDQSKRTSSTCDCDPDSVIRFNNKRIVEKNGLFIQSYTDLVKHNIDSITNRINVSHRHKLYNHIARVQYLNYIYPKHKEVPISDTIKELLYFLWQNRANMQIYNYNREYNSNEFMLSMIGNFLKDLRVEGKTKPNAQFIVLGEFTVKKKVKDEKGNIEEIDSVILKYKPVTTRDLLALYDHLIIPGSLRKTHKITRRKSLTNIRSVRKTRKRQITKSR